MAAPGKLMLVNCSHNSMQKKQDILAQPLCIQLADNHYAYLKIDILVVDDDICALGGWQSEIFVLEIESASAKIPILHHDRFFRKDVNCYLKTDSSFKHGFGIAFKINDSNTYNIIAGNDSFQFDISKADFGIESGYESVLGETLIKFINSRKEASQSWKNYVEGGLSPIKCCLDHVLRWPDNDLNNPVVAVGWVAIPDNVKIYIADELQNCVSVMMRFTRPDISKSYDIFCGESSQKNGFILIIKNYPVCNDKIAICIDKDGIKAKIAERKIINFYGYRLFLKALFEIDFLQTEMSDIYQDIFMPLLMDIQKKRVKAIMAGRYETGVIGRLPSDSSVSVIIPLYGTLDLLETQVQRFAWDAAFQDFAELIYVVSDPCLLDQFKLSFEKLQQRYNVSCRWVYAYRSLGFAEANNLGAALARGAYCVFVNSDIYPVRRDWLQALCGFLADHPDAGLVGCHLVYPDGKSQHSGAILCYNSMMKIWDCIHLHDNNGRAPKQVDYIIGACLAVRKSDFCDVKGFCIDYLIGNSEDLDFCEKLKKNGKQIWYLPMIPMIHENHHTFESMGKEKWLDRLFLYNAAMFAKKWKMPIE